MSGRTSPFTFSLRSPSLSGLSFSLYFLSLLFLSPHTSQDEPS